MLFEKIDFALHIALGLATLLAKVGGQGGLRLRHPPTRVSRLNHPSSIRRSDQHNDQSGKEWLKGWKGTNEWTEFGKGRSAVVRREKSGHLAESEMKCNWNGAQTMCSSSSFFRGYVALIEWGYVRSWCVWRSHTDTLNGSRVVRHDGWQNCIYSDGQRTECPLMFAFIDFTGALQVQTIRLDKRTTTYRGRSNWIGNVLVLVANANAIDPIVGVYLASDRGMGNYLEIKRRNIIRFLLIEYIKNVFWKYNFKLNAAFFYSH